MKKALLIFLVLGPILIKAQSIIDTSKVWHVVECLNQGGCGTSVFRFGSDTTIGVYQYKKLIADSGHTHLLGNPFALREDTIAKRVYFYEGTMEYLAYDFSLNKGDTVSVRCSIPMTVDSVDTISLLNGELRKRMFLSNYDEIWIEGIGSLFGLPYPGIYFCAFDISVELNCFEENDTIKYENAFYPDCYYNTLSVQELNTGNNIRINPNPFSNFTTLEFENPLQDESTLSIISPSGRLLKQIRNIKGSEVMIERDQLNSGIYFLQIKTDKGLMSNGKIIVQ